MGILDDANEELAEERRIKELQAAREREQAERLASGSDYVYMLNAEAAEAVQDFTTKMHELAVPTIPVYRTKDNKFRERETFRDYAKIVYLTRATPFTQGWGLKDAVVTVDGQLCAAKVGYFKDEEDHRSLATEPVDPSKSRGKTKQFRIVGRITGLGRRSIMCALLQSANIDPIGVDREFGGRYVKYPYGDAFWEGGISLYNMLLGRLKQEMSGA